MLRKLTKIITSSQNINKENSDTRILYIQLSVKIHPHLTWLNKNLRYII